MVALLSTILGLFAAFMTGVIIRRYFIFTSGERKTNLRFVPDYNLLTGSRGLIFTGEVMAVNIHKLHAQLGDTFGGYFGRNMQIFTRDADLIYRVFVEEFQMHPNRYYVNSPSSYFKASLLEARDDDWRNSRRAVGSVLKASKLKADNVGTDIDATIARMLSNIDKRCKAAKARGEEPVIDAFVINKNFMMQSLLKIIYNSDEVLDFDNDNNTVVTNLTNLINNNFDYVCRLCFLVPILTEMLRPLISLFTHGKFMGQITVKLEQIIRANAVELQKTDRNQHRTIHSLMKSYKNGELSREQLIGNAAFMMVASFATTVDSMSALMLELANNQDAQDKLRTDLMQYGETSKYLEQCINETLRMHPGAMTNRDLTRTIKTKNITLVRGSCLSISIYSLHRDPKYWGPDGNVWKPERFAPHLVKNFHPAQFVPFGLGPRNCVGYHLARFELTKFTTQLVLRFRIERCKATPARVELDAQGTLPFALPVKGPIHLKFTPLLGS